MGDTVIMRCNTTQPSGATWTKNTTHDGFSYAYIDGTINGSRFSVVNGSTLRIYNVQPTDSGFYDCYDKDERKVVGYYVIAKSMFIIVLRREIKGR